MDKPDIGQLSNQDLAPGEFPGGDRQPFRLHLTPEVHERIHKHAAESPSVEICGVLVGQWHKDPAGPFAAITEVIRGEAATSKFAEVTFTHETWAKINQEMDTRFSQLTIVGWYHSHPDFGIFLSDRDLFIQQHFFSGSGQIAYVVDPVRKQEGMFVWRLGKPVLAPFFWVGDRPVPAPAAGAPLESKSGSEMEAPGRVSGHGPQHAGLLDQFLPLAGMLAVFVLGFLFGANRGESRRDQLEQEAVAHAALMLGVKPGLNESLDRTLGNLEALAGQVVSLERQASPPAKEKEQEQRELWKAVRENLAATQEQLRGLQKQYSLTPEQTQRMLTRAAYEVVRRAPDIPAEEQEKAMRLLTQAMLADIQENWPKLVGVKK